MSNKRIDGGLVIVGLVLIGVGLYALLGQQVHFSPVAPREDGGFGGWIATVIGVIMILGGLYFLKESRK
ncbi:hypothetical protein [Thioalkalivibrio sp. ALJ24]|uniref:hypothetical protein n=1 Tax=Thioalkalivibrio sp. ALJ24 TaxID=545276 RepID=UPI0003A2F9A2|nr:hypothetical protein [Thioalkalivibrio sp. ALJ24]